jgi:DNA-binding MarR family transcriptional regulator
MYLDRDLKSLHVRSGQIPILRILEIRGGINQESIRRYLHLDKGSIAKNIRPLITEGYITRETDPSDKRSYRIFLTEKGREILPAVGEALEKWNHILTAGFSEEEKAAMAIFLSRMSENVRAHFKLD